jgi:hypothetical protein
VVFRARFQRGLGCDCGSDDVDEWVFDVGGVHLAVEEEWGIFFSLLAVRVLIILKIQIQTKH